MPVYYPDYNSFRRKKIQEVRTHLNVSSLYRDAESAYKTILPTALPTRTPTPTPTMTPTNSLVNNSIVSISGDILTTLDGDTLTSI
jgi:hypothetical protein